MHNKEIVIFDTEYTAWEGSQERKWTGPNEYKEIVQIAAISIDAHTLEEKDEINLYILPEKNPKLSEYFTNLTGITQETVDRKGVAFKEAVEKFSTFCDTRKIYSFGGDERVFRENATVLGLSMSFSSEQFFDVKDIFRRAGIDPTGYMSSTIVEAFGGKSKLRAHEALNDVRTIVEALRIVKKRGLLNLEQAFNLSAEFP